MAAKQAVFRKQAAAAQKRSVRAKVGLAKTALATALKGQPVAVRKALRGIASLAPHLRASFDWASFIAMLIAAMGGGQKPPVPAPPPTPVPGEPPVPQPPVIPPPAPFEDSSHGRPAQSLTIRSKGIKRRGKGHLQGKELKDVQSGAEAGGPGDVFNFDAKAVDQKGKEIGPYGSTPHTALDQFLYDPEYGTYTSADPNAVTTTGKRWRDKYGDEGWSNHRPQYRLVREGAASVNVVGEYRDYGLPFNVKVEDDTGEGSWTIQEYVVLPDGRELESNVLGPYRTKWWGKQ